MSLEIVIGIIVLMFLGAALVIGLYLIGRIGDLQVLTHLRCREIQRDIEEKVTDHHKGDPGEIILPDVDSGELLGNWISEHEAELKSIDVTTSLIKMNSEAMLLAVSRDIETEDKEMICRALCYLLQLTREGDGIDTIKYHRGGEAEIARVIFSSGYSKDIDITADSGIAIIRDVINGI